jgi:peroxiredoxin
MEHDRSASKPETDTLAEIAIAAASAAVPGALRAGARAPLFTLPDREGMNFSLDRLLMSGPVVLNFLRGAWCASGAESLVQFASTYERIVTFGAAAVAIAPPYRLTLSQDALPMPELIDTDMRVASAFGLAFDLPVELRPRYLELGYVPPHTPNAKSFLVPIPATYLVDQDGVVVLAYVDVDYRNRFDDESLLTALHALQVRRNASERERTTFFAGRRRSRRTP